MCPGVDSSSDFREQKSGVHHVFCRLWVTSLRRGSMVNREEEFRVYFLLLLSVIIDLLFSFEFSPYTVYTWGRAIGVSHGKLSYDSVSSHFLSFAFLAVCPLLCVGFLISDSTPAI